MIHLFLVVPRWQVHCDSQAHLRVGGDLQLFAVRNAPAFTTFVRRAWATRLATAQLAIRDRALSARLVRITGTRVPRTRPALSALARKVSCLTSMFPASSSGASGSRGWSSPRSGRARARVPRLVPHSSWDL